MIRDVQTIKFGTSLTPQAHALIVVLAETHGLQGASLAKYLTGLAEEKGEAKRPGIVQRIQQEANALESLPIKEQSERLQDFIRAELRAAHGS